MYVRLNLATKPLISHRRFLAGSALLAVLGCCLFLMLGWRFYTLRKADADLRVRTGKVQQQMAAELQARQELDSYFNQQESAGLQGRAKLITNVIEARSFNWTRLFMALEQTIPPGVHVIRIEPKLEKGTVSVNFVVGASSETAKVKLLKAFEDSRSFEHVQLLSDKAATEPGKDPYTIEFTVVYTNI
jgi:hypothetical protein